MSDEADELAEVEARVAARRHELEHAMSAWLRQRQAAAVSPKGLLAAVAAGVLIGVVLRSRRRKPAAPAAAPTAAPAASGVLGVLAGLAMSLLRMRYGTPLNALASLLPHLRRAPPPPPGMPGGEPSVLPTVLRAGNRGPHWHQAPRTRRAPPP